MRRPVLLRCFTSMAAALLLPQLASAQWRPASVTPNPCFDTIPASAMTRVLVYLLPFGPDTARAAQNAAALFAQDVAAALKPLLDDSSGAVPAGEPRLRWQQLDGVLPLVLFRDGRRRVVEDAGPFTGAIALVARAQASLSNDSEADLVPSPGPDSLLVALRLAWPTVDSAGHPRRPTARPLVPAFTIAYPWVEPVEPLHAVQPSYPSRPRFNNVEGTVVLDFVVDTSGRADPATLRAMWPAGVSTTGVDATWYRDFLDAAWRGVKESRYRPARIGGCVTRQLVSQPFSFQMHR